MDEPLNRTASEPASTTMSPERAAGAPSLERLLSGVFQAWRQAGLPFLILRNYEGLPASTTNDVDVLVHPAQIRAAERVLREVAPSAGYRLHNRIEFASLVLYLHHPQSGHQVQMDLYPRLAWRGFTTLSAEAMLARRIERGPFAVPHPVDEAASSLLGRLLQHGKVGDKYKAKILAAFDTEPQLAASTLATPFGPALAEAVVRRARAQDWAGVERLTTALRRALVRRALKFHPARTVRALADEACRLARRWWHPGGMTLVVLGADGSGKSTVAALAIEKLRATFSPGKGLQIHWKPVVFSPARRQPTGKPDINPHGKLPRGRIASLFYLSGHWLEFFLGSHLQFRPVLFRGGLVLIDRYYYDFLVDQRRYRLQVPHWLVRASFGLLRQPDLVFFLDAPAAVLQARKQEVPAEETARQVEAYRHVVQRLRQGRILDATQSAEQVATELTGQVLSWLEGRLREREK